MSAELRLVSLISLANFGPVWAGAGAGTEGVAGATDEIGSGSVNRRET